MMVCRKSETHHSGGPLRTRVSAARNRSPEPIEIAGFLLPQE
jgi:hypothetical protein